MPKKGYKQSKEHTLAIARANKGHETSEETKRKIGLSLRGQWVNFGCANCGKKCSEKISHYKKSKRHFCSKICRGIAYSKFPFYEQANYRGIRKIGEPKWIYSTRYRKNHPERISHLKARRYARERNAEGSHSFEEWQELCRKSKWKCVGCNKKKKLTKDHIKPLSLGGADYILNIQPLCRSCNSRKWKKLIYENPDLLNNPS